MSTENLAVLPSLSVQAQKLIDLGLIETLDSLTAAELLDSAGDLEQRSPEGALLVLGRQVCSPSTMAPFLSLPAPGKTAGYRQGFVVEDMMDVDQFAPVADLSVPEAKVYAISAPNRGDDMSNWSPEEAAARFGEIGASPLLLTEGIHWALQQPEVLDPGHCFMTIGSRLKKANGTFDARTPALWISGGTGRDGKERKGAPKVGWCWWRNRHTWLGFASTNDRIH